jgi:hypothetical protein
MRPAPLSLGHEIAFFHQLLQAQLHGARLAVRELHDLAERVLKDVLA